MKKLIKRVYATNESVTNSIDDYTFTADNVVEILSQIKELKDRSIALEATSDGKVQITVGEDLYEVFG
ncbi:hypothetical protein [uncultured Ruminococcus sp.]|uniref:hypothetical protein n=1 Tax=uncultured Ruminococcus sp. TaxID=165186 RepID=UPI0025E5A521|nr:hypothetical protein [uncultured Ruminococcus sp.]